MHLKIVNFLKQHKLIAYVVLSLIRMPLKIAVSILPKKNKIVFISFGGRSFNDSPRALYDKMCEDPFFDTYSMVWVFTDPAHMQINKGKKVKVDTLAYLLEITTAKVWISNSGMDRGVGIIPTSQTLNVNTWHGTPIKKLGEDIVANENSKFKKKKKLDIYSLYCVQNNHDYSVLKRMFNADDSCFRFCDLPRNDELFSYSPDRIKSIKNSLGIAEDKKVILYTPTFREYKWNKNNENFIDIPLNLSLWKKSLKDQYVILIRAHYAVTEAINIGKFEFCIDVSDYSNINDLYIISDAMISDYSSTFIDYSILDRPMFCYAYDLEEYISKRGLYDEIFNDLPCKVCTGEEELLTSITEMDYRECCKRTAEFHQKYAPYAGHATESIIADIKKYCTIGNLKGERSL